MTDRGHAHGFVLKQSLDHLHAHLPVKAVDGLGRRVPEHIKNSLGVAGDRMIGFVGVVHDLGAAQYDADDQCREEHDPQ